jgi:hypothetical protein
MSIHVARKWLIYASLATTAAAFVFFLLAPVFGFPLTFDQAIRLLEILLPVFLGYLGTATHFILREPETPSRRSISSRGRGELLTLLVRGPVIVFALATIAAIAAFGISNSASAEPGSGMSVDTLAVILTAVLGILTVSTNLLVASLFPSKEGAAPLVPSGGTH